MITVILALQHRYGLFLVHAVLLAQQLNLIEEDGMQLFLGYTAEGIEAGIETDVIGLIESAKHADLREFSYSREQHKLQVLVGQLKDTIESLEYLAVIILKRLYLANHHR